MCVNPPLPGAAHHAHGLHEVAHAVVAVSGHLAHLHITSIICLLYIYDTDHAGGELVHVVVALPAAVQRQTVDLLLAAAGTGARHREYPGGQPRPGGGWLVAPQEVRQPRPLAAEGSKTQEKSC